MSVIQKIVLAVDSEGKEHKVIILDKNRRPGYSSSGVVDMYLCLETSGETFYTDNIKKFYTVVEQHEIRTKLFKDYIF